MYIEYESLELEEMLGNLRRETSAENEAQQVIARIKAEMSNSTSATTSHPIR